MRSFDFVVIGSGPAGQRGAVQAAKAGYQVAIIEKSGDLGGVCINTGTLPSKTLREAVLDLSGTRERAIYGEAAPRSEEVTIEQLLSRTRHVMQNERAVIEGQLRRNRVKLIRGAGRFVGPNQIEVVSSGNSETIEAKKVLIAVGTYPAVRASRLDPIVALRS